MHSYLLCCCGIPSSVFFFKTKVTIQQQQLHFNGNEIKNPDLLSSVGVKDGDLLTMLVTNER
jgi:hypothetical protein